MLLAFGKLKTTLIPTCVKIHPEVFKCLLLPSCALLLSGFLRAAFWEVP